MQSRGNQLIIEFLGDPARFDGYELLKEYYAGFPIETLVPLLSSSDQMVRRVSTWIASELSKKARPLIDSVVPLLNDPDPQVRFSALEVIAVCSFAEDIQKYVHVLTALEDPHDYIRARVMFFVSNAEASQIEAALWSVKSDKPDEKLHKAGLSQLVTAHLATKSEILAMIDSAEPLLRKYGAILAWRCRDRFPELLSCLASNADQDVRKFWEQRANR